MKHHNYNKTVFVVVVLLFTVAACFSYKKMSRQNMTFIYSDTEFMPKTELVLFHHSLDSSALYFRINTNDLLYIRDTYSNKLYASFTIKYELLEYFDAKNTYDSLTYNFSDTVFDTKNAFIIDSIFMGVPPGRDYVLKIKTTDNIRRRSFVQIVNIRKTNSRSAQNFFVANTQNDIIFNSYFNEEADVQIYHNDINVSFLTVKYYPIRFPIASPPFNLTAQKPTLILPDSVFTIEITDGKSGLLKLSGEGIYRILADSNAHECLTLFRFHKDYPEITIPEQMIFTARYLTSRQEFDHMMIQADKRRAIESFWMDIAGNKERARQLIRKYYGRVKMANKFFASYHEGWKTDRGMIYIIFGQPGHVYLSGDSENWIYGEPSNMRSLNFMFYKVDNPLVDNDYMLSKSETYRDSWHFAVSNWRR